MSLSKKVINFATLAMVIVLGLVAVAYVASSFFVRSYNVDNGSMRPTLPIGAKVFVQPETHYEAGDIITFHALETKGGQTLVITHRIVGFNDDGSLITKGDFNDDRDYPALPITQKDVVGRVVWSMPYVGGIQMWMQSNVVMCIGVLMFLLVLFFATSEPTERSKEEAIVEREVVTTNPA